jgi:hypothetical protein
MGMGAADAYFIGFITRQGDLVSKADTLENGPKLMETIGPFSQNIENKI